MTPTIESMNPMSGVRQQIKSINQIVDYCEEKELRRKRSEEKGETLAQNVKRQINEEQERGRKIQEAEHKEFIEDQQQMGAQPDVVIENIVEIDDKVTEDARRESTKA